ncbi:hypothetical protein BDV96DRAFT_564367 [Lophiotrema nucula]|uniref:Uncharacterized protein n=1 Tax=Lophiotrema nucula TaxID=690887 RepID=A0A6A5ZT65_9PLEO|nr:hypothetical protein BDV96DRAFT_564367 [Lophiotrema nucula]
MDSDVEETEPTVLEYARFHGLALDYLSELLLTSDLPIPSSDSVEADLNGASDVLPTNAIDELTKERLAVPKEAALLLKSVHDLQKAWSNVQLTTDRRKDILKLKLELPVLRTDPELDLINFGSTALPILDDLRIPSEPVNTEQDETLEWPSRYFLYPKQCETQAKSEKLVVSKDSLTFIQNAIKDDWSSEGSEKIKSEGLTYKRNPAWQLLTPPLLPLSPPLTPYIPSSPGNRLELLSDSSNSVAAEAKALEESIMKADAILHHVPNVGNDPMLFDGEDLTCFDPLEALLNQPPILKRKADHLRIEGPLTPPILSQSPTKKLKSVTFTENLHEYIPALPSTYESGDGVLSPDDDFASFFQQIEPMVNEMNNSIENEKLSEVDTTRRVDVPDVDFSLPIAPWNEFRPERSSKQSTAESELEAQSKYVVKVKREHFRLMASWHGLSKLERDLIWSPFQSQPPSIMINEKLKDDGDVLGKLKSYLAENDITASSNYIWKHDGLRILQEDEDDDEDELEAGEFKEIDDMEALVRKRKLEIDEEEADAVTGRKLATATQSVLVQRVPSKQIEPERQATVSAYFDARAIPGTIASSHELEQGKREHHAFSSPQSKRKTSTLKSICGKEEDDSSLMFGGTFSATNALHRFMQIHGQSAMTNENDIDEPIPGRSAPTSVSSVLPRANTAPRSNRPAVVQAHAECRSESSEMLPPLLPQLPGVPHDLPASDYMISAILLQQRQRSLRREIERLYPEAIFTERDFDVPYSPIQEADILLSPSTGLIFTTLQLIKQRALPGQPNRSAIKERIARLQLRYERLVVLISEGLSKDMEETGSGRVADSRDTEALMDLTSYSSRTGAEVAVKYIQGGDLALARTIVQEMAKWGLPRGSKDIGALKLLHEETLWELFLRRIGFNPFAAQAILASLKTPYDLPLTSSSPAASDHSSRATVSVFGLPAFILMSAQERIQRFQVLLGGSRILTRANALLDQEWPSAVHGFAV